MPPSEDRPSDLKLNLKDWLDINMSQFLDSVRDDYDEDLTWHMPVVEDFVLVVSVKDYKDGGVGTFSLANNSLTSYRTRGLLHDALD